MRFELQVVLKDHKTNRTIIDEKFQGTHLEKVAQQGESLFNSLVLAFSEERDPEASTANIV